MNKKYFYALIFLVAATGLSLFAYKVHVLGIPVAPDQNTEVWSAEVRVSFDVEKGPVKVTLEIPSSKLSKFAILEENFVSKDFGMTLHESSIARQVQWTVRRASGREALYYRVDV
jgi:hypothetical protein